MTALQQLKDLALEKVKAKFPSQRYHYSFVHKYTDSTSNGLTKCILDWLHFNGWQCERIAVTGRLIDQRDVIKDICGRQRLIGSTKWIKGSMQAGTADLSAIIKGQSVKIEIKICKDIQSEAQKKYQKQVEEAGGVYLIVKDFKGFLDWYCCFMKG